MSIHFSAKRPTRLKTANVDEEKGLKGLAVFSKLTESSSEEISKSAREIKVLVKKLDKLYKDNQKKKDKNKLTEKDCEKEKKLAAEVDTAVSNMNYLISTIDSIYDKVETSKILTPEGKIITDWLHTMESDTPE